MYAKITNRLFKILTANKAAAYFDFKFDSHKYILWYDMNNTLLIQNYYSRMLAGKTKTF
jgi:hypothetical protein